MGTRMFQQSMRNALAPLIVFMGQEIDIDNTLKGKLLSAIAFGYLFTQVPGGKLADRFGAKNVMSATLALSACCCIAVPTCADLFGTSGVWAVMALMGLVQGPLFPTSTVFLSRWMPKKSPDGTDEKAWGSGVLDIGTSMGSLCVIPVANTLASVVGWRNAFRAVGVGSLCFVAFWHMVAAETPARCAFISAEELEFLEDHVPKPQRKSITPGSEGVLGMPMSVATHPGLWAVIFAHISYNYGVYLITNWGPTYFSEVLGLPPAEAKYHLMMPFITSMVVGVMSPFLLAAVERRGASLLATRRLFTSLGFCLAALAMLPVHRLQGLDPWFSTVLLSVGSAFFGLTPSGFKANYLDITERYVGLLSGYGNTCGTLATWLGPQLVAILLDFSSWDVVFASVALANVAAAINYALHSTVTPIEASVALGAGEDGAKVE